MLIYLLSETNLARFPIPMPYFSSLVLLAVHCRLAWHTLLHLILNLYIRVSVSCQGCVTSQSMTLSHYCVSFGLLSLLLACGPALQCCLPGSSLRSPQLLCSPQLGRGPAKAVLLLPGAVCPGFVQRITIFLCLCPESKTVN